MTFGWGVLVGVVAAISVEAIALVVLVWATGFERPVLTDERR